MLQKIRDKSRGVFAKIFIGFVVLVFGLWGVEYLVGSLVNTTPPVVSVNGSEITEVQVNNETQRRMQQLASSLGPDADLSSLNESNVRQNVIDGLIRQELLFQAAQELDMTVSPSALDRQIASIPDFQVDGVFNNERAQSILRSAGYTPNSFRAALVRDTILNQLMAAYAESNFITPAEMEMLASLTKQKRDFRYLLINMEQRALDIDISDEDIETYYRNNENEFMREEQVAIEYIELNKNDIAGEIEIDEEQIRQAYASEREAYESQIERRASHILLEASTQEERTEALELASELKERLDAGESFDELAMEYSDDVGSAQDGGDVGYTTGDTFVEPFEQALQQLEVGEVSDPVETEFGVHLIKLTEESASEFESFEQARDRIARELREEEAERIYNERAQRLATLAFESLDLDQPAESLDLEKQTTDLFGRSGGSGITANQDVIDAAFSATVLQDGLNSDPIRIDDSRTVVLRVIEHNPPAVRELSEVRGEIEVILRNQRVAEMARGLGHTIVETLRAGSNINSILQDQGLQWRRMEDAGRDNTEINPEILDRVFSMPKPPSEEEPTIEGFQLEGGEYAVVELSNVTPGTLEDMDEDERASMRAFVTQQTGQAEFEAYVNSLETSAEITRPSRRLP